MSNAEAAAVLTILKDSDQWNLFWPTPANAKLNIDRIIFQIRRLMLEKKRWPCGRKSARIAADVNS